MTTLAELLAPQTVQQVFQKLLAVYQANGFPVQSWQVGGTERTRLMAIATAITDLNANYTPGIAAGGFADLAPGTGWMPLLAEQMYNLEQLPAQFTVGNIVMTAAAGVGPVNVTAGSLIAVFAATGNRYTGPDQDIVIPLSGSVTGSFVAEFAGASYNDPSSSGNLTLVTPIPGVTLSNPAGTYSEVAHVGSGTGTLTLAGSPVSPHQVTIRIDSSGDAGVASWSYSIDGAAYVSVGAVASATNLGGDDIDVTLDDADSPSFIEGDTYTFANPGNWITEQGSDVETDTALSARCKARWSTLSVIGVTSLYELLIRSVPGVGTQVTQVIVQPDPDINNKLNIVVAGPAGVLPVDTIADLQTWIIARTPITVYPVVLSPTPIAVELSGVITCPATLLSAVQDAVETAMTDYINSVPINGVVRIASIIDAVMEVTGVVDITDVEINGTPANLTLGSTSTFELADLDPLAFTYVTT